jgi:hypothetical protein
VGCGLGMSVVTEGREVKCRDERGKCEGGNAWSVTLLGGQRSEVQ